MPALLFNLGIVFSEQGSTGGGGGGFTTAGNAGTLTPFLMPGPSNTLGGSALSLLPLPSAAPSLDHFVAGGSGGGGSGASGLMATAFTPRFRAGLDGGHGGGGLLIRAGGDVDVTGSIDARGGQGGQQMGPVVIEASPPGGGGSGGGVLIQSGGLVQGSSAVMVTWASAESPAFPSSFTPFAVTSGAGGDRSTRIEDSSGQQTPLLDRDAVSGALFYNLAPGTVGNFGCYRIEVRVGQSVLLFSDDPTLTVPLATVARECNCDSKAPASTRKPGNRWLARWGHGATWPQTCRWTAHPRHALTS